MNIREDTARTVLVGPILDADGVAKTDEVVASVLASKNGGSPGALNGSATLTHAQTGYYLLALTATDTNTAGCLEITLNSGTNTMPIKAMNVMPTPAWDALYSASDGSLRADTVAISDDSNAADYLEAILDGTGGVTLGAFTIQSNTASVPALKLVATDTASALQCVGAGIGYYGIDCTAGGIYVLSDELMAFLAAQLDAAVSTRSTHSAADVWSVGTRALTDKNNFNLAANQAGVTLGTVSTVTSTTTVSGDVQGKVLGGGVSSITGTGARVVDAAGANVAPAGTALSNAVWTDAKAGYLDTAVSGIAAAVWAVGSRTLTSFGTLVADVAAAVWAVLTSTLTAVGSIGKLLVDNINATIGSRSSHTAADVKTTMEAAGGHLALILEDTGTTLPGTLATIQGYVDCLPTTWVTVLDAAGVRAAVGLATANLDTQLGDIPTNAEMEARTLVAANYATAATQTTLTTHLTDIKGTGFVKDTDSLKNLAHIGADGDTLETLSDQLDTLEALVSDGAYTGVITVQDGDGNPLAGAVVSATRSGVLKTTGRTDVSGQVTNWTLGAYTYTVAARLDGYTGSTDSLTVSGVGWTKTLTLTAIAITAPTSPGICTVQFRVYLSGAAVEGAICRAKLLGTNQAIDGTILSNEESTDTTDSNGVAELSLVQKGSIVKGNGIYKISVEIDEKPVASVQTAIPTQSSVLFEDLIF